MVKFEDVVYANFANLAYINWDGIKPNTDLKDAIFDIRKKNTKKLNTTTEHIFMVYSEDERNESPLWDKYFDGWRFLCATNGSKLYKHLNIPDFPDCGFYAVAFTNGEDIIISYRGTNDIMDGIADIQLYTRSLSFQLVYAYKFLTETRFKYATEHKRIHLTGHSLGGALVQAMMSTDEASHIEQAITFNAFGIKDTLDNWKDKKMMDWALTNCVGWMGIPNSGMLVKELKCMCGLNEDARHSKQSMLKYIYNVQDIENAVKRCYTEYERSGNFNVVLEKDSKIFDNLKYQFGTVASMKKEERDEMKTDIFRKDIEIIGLEHKCWLLFDLLKYLVAVTTGDKNDMYRNRGINYIISRDLVGSCQPHLGKTIKIDTWLDDDVIVIKPWPTMIDKALSRLHSVGNFFMFLSDNGMFEGHLRRSVLMNLVRDYALTHGDYANLTEIDKKAIDLILNIPVVMSMDKAFLVKYGFGYLYEGLLRSLILEHDGRTITLGKYGNIKHDAIDFRKDPFIIKIV